MFPENIDEFNQIKNIAHLEELIKSENQKLLPAHSLFATVSQVKEVKGENGKPTTVVTNRS